MADVVAGSGRRSGNVNGVVTRKGWRRRAASGRLCLGLGRMEKGQIDQQKDETIVNVSIHWLKHVNPTQPPRGEKEGD